LCSISRGPREIVIPCGEVSCSDARWGWRFETKGSKYGRLHRLSIGLGKVPPKTTVDIAVANIRVLPEVPAALVNPVITLGAGSLQIAGTVSSESYVWYKGGDTIGVYDLNWNKIADLPVRKTGLYGAQGVASDPRRKPGRQSRALARVPVFCQGRPHDCACEGGQAE
jgi:hypothetical protein